MPEFPEEILRLIFDHVTRGQNCKTLARVLLVNRQWLQLASQLSVLECRFRPDAGFSAAPYFLLNVLPCLRTLRAEGPFPKCPYPPPLNLRSLALRGGNIDQLLIAQSASTLRHLELTRCSFFPKMYIAEATLRLILSGSPQPNGDDPDHPTKPTHLHLESLIIDKSNRAFGLDPVWDICGQELRLLSVLGGNTTFPRGIPTPCWPNLRVLRADSPDVLDNVMHGAFPQLEYLHAALQMASPLGDDDSLPGPEDGCPLCPCPNLNRLRLRVRPQGVVTPVIKLLDRLAASGRVKRLSLRECSALPDDILGAILALFVRCPVERLSLRSCFQLTTGTLIGLLSGLPRLSHVDLSMCRGVTDDGLVALCQKCPQLRTLRLRQLMRIRDVGPLQRCASSLVRLNLRSVQHIPAPSLALLFASFAWLDALNLRECTPVNDSCLQALAASPCCKFGRLRDLNLRGCRLVSPEAIADVVRATRGWVEETGRERYLGLQKLDVRGCDLVTREALCYTLSFPPNKCDEKIRNLKIVEKLDGSIKSGIWGRQAELLVATLENLATLLSLGLDTAIAAVLLDEVGTRDGSALVVSESDVHRGKGAALHEGLVRF
ncbi:hypothetical protein PAPYR_2497 [Paratrimastix pyriformis]|uniref:F-box domain-containing protein n=1 Tax=Paratrimastix pyriformis TaxID=342808 RepID=A0ABQ8UWB8_9EUKA|nr:hypothetical protein PAPYR_2497 [Paratrimastix pyriformis]